MTTSERRSLKRSLACDFVALAGHMCVIIPVAAGSDPRWLWAYVLVAMSGFLRASEV